MIQSLLLALGAYLLGGISFARIVGARVLPGQDLSRTDLVLPGGSEATIGYTGVSATSVGARLGPKWGLITGGLDALKGFLPVLATRLIWPLSDDHLLVATMIIVGHNWPVWFRFRGGRGQSSLLGSLLAIDPLAPLVAIPLGAAIGLLGLRDMIVAYYLGQPLLIAWFLIFGTPAEVAYAIAINVVIAIASIPEMRDYLQARADGKVRQLTSWRDLAKAHPAMGSDRYGVGARDHEPPT